jgi:hypothetical protein
MSIENAVNFNTIVNGINGLVAQRQRAEQNAILANVEDRMRQQEEERRQLMERQSVLFQLKQGLSGLVGNLKEQPEESYIRFLILDDCMRRLNLSADEFPTLEYKNLCSEVMGEFPKIHAWMEKELPMEVREKTRTRFQQELAEREEAEREQVRQRQRQLELEQEQNRIRSALLKEIRVVNILAWVGLLCFFFLGPVAFFMCRGIRKRAQLAGMDDVKNATTMAYVVSGIPTVILILGLVIFVVGSLLGHHF